MGSRLTLNFGSIPVDVVARVCRPEAFKLFVWAKVADGAGATATGDVATIVQLQAETHGDAVSYSELLI